VITDEGPKLKPRVYGGLTRHRSPRYEAVNAMLLNKFLKEHRKVEQQETTIAQQDRKIQEQGATITRLQKGMEFAIMRLDEQASQIRKVSAELEARKSSPQIVLNNQ
jgi:phosphatidylserine decarboxylase